MTITFLCILVNGLVTVGILDNFQDLPEAFLAMAGDPMKLLIGILMESGEGQKGKLNDRPITANQLTGGDSKLN